MEKYHIAISPSSFADGDSTALELLENANIKFRMNPYKRRLTEVEAIEFVKDIDGLIAGVEPLTRKVLKSAGKLKAIARVGVGLSNIDLKSAKELGIKISNTPDGPTDAVAEMTITALLAISRNLIQFNADLHQSIWKKSVGFGLIEKNILIIGYGRIGRKFARLASSFGANILVHDSYIPTQITNIKEKYVSLTEGLKHADIISLHASGEEPIINETEFNNMKQGVILLNSSRGALIDEDALISALDSKKIYGAWFDVFKKEPYEGRLLKYPNVLLTPHIGTYTQQCRLSMEVGAVNNILQDLGLKT